MMTVKNLDTGLLKMNGGHKIETANTGLVSLIGSLTTAPSTQTSPIKERLSKGYIRLIHLYPPKVGADPDQNPLEFDLEHYDRCDSSSIPSYTALSYAWGQNTGIVSANIDGRPQTISYVVEEALRQIRHETEYMYIWLDQICIDQEDNEEKSEQVLQMRHIYQDAASVIAWVGPAFPQVGLLFEVLKELAAAHEASTDTLDPLWNIFENPARFLSIKKPFKLFCERVYWSRMWIMQEFTLPGAVSIRCGNFSISPEEVRGGINPRESLIEAVGGSEENLERFHRLNKAVHRVLNPPTRSFMLSVLTRRQRFHYELENEEYGDPFYEVLGVCLPMEADYNFPQTTDPRDRVFSLLYLASDFEEFEHILDYSSTCHEVYFKTAITLLQQGHIDVLQFCQFPKTLTDLPTWVPDWSMPIRSPCLRNSWFTKFCATKPAPFQQDVSIVARGTIQILGVDVDEVKEVGNVWDPDWLDRIDLDAARDFLKDIDRLCHKSQRVRAHEELLEAIRIATLDGALYGDEHINDGSIIQYISNFMWGFETRLQLPHENTVGQLERSDEAKPVVDSKVNRPKRRKVMPKEIHRLRGTETLLERVNRHKERCLDDSSGGEEEGASVPFEEASHQWIVDALQFQHSRRAFITKSGWVGLGPSHMEPGDEVALLYGGKVPYALRKEQNGAHSMVGETFVHGIMYGEFFKTETTTAVYHLV